jgi:4-hydroxybenzoate polyprenyltransferase
MQPEAYSVQKLRDLVRLTRWREFAPFVLPVTGLGVILGATQRHTMLDWRLSVVVLANLLANAYAFMINDIEDAPDDARDPSRAQRNLIANGDITPFEGWVAAGFIAAIALCLFAALGPLPLLTGACTLVLAHLYSWKAVRLKAWPVTDLVSHVLMLSGLLFAAGYFVYSSEPGQALIVALALILISAYGQLYNQLRDFEADRAAGLKNTAILLGQTITRMLSYACLAAAGLCIAISIVLGLIPLWIVSVTVAIGLGLTLLLRPTTDMRGARSSDVSGNLQTHLLLACNFAFIVWIVVYMLRL